MMPALLTRMSQRAEVLLDARRPIAAALAVSACRTRSRARSPPIALATSRRVLRVASRHCDARAGARERRRDLAADAARAAGDERDASAQIDLSCEASSDEVVDVGQRVPQVIVRAPGTMRLTSVESTAPGPISTNSASGMSRQ